MTSSSDQPGAMALLEKYSTLHRAIEEARDSVAQCVEQQEDVRDKIQRAQEERAEMEASTARAQDETQDLHQQVQEALKQDSLEEDRHAQALLEYTHARQRYNVTQQFVENQRQTQAERARDFQNLCKRLRVTASAIGESEAPSYAFLAIHESNIDSDDMMTAWKPDHESESARRVSEDELELASQQHAQTKQVRDNAKHGLSKVQQDEQSCRERATSRQQRKERLQTQLEKIRSDVQGLREQLDAVQKETTEATEMAESFKRDATNRKRARSTVTPSPHMQQQQRTGSSRGPPRNPYSRPTTTTSQSTTRPTAVASQNTARVTTNQNRTTQASTPYGRASLQQRQHPHRSGRIRVDRQFTTALGVISGHDDDGAEEENEFDSQPVVRGATAYNTTGGGGSYFLDDEEDDDDDALLSYVAFSNH